MNPVVISCKTMEKELLEAMKRLNCSFPVLWLDAGLHNWPDKLRDSIQALLDSCDGFDTVLLAMSFCGNSVVGLRTHDFRLIIPRCDDCITLLLGSAEKRRSLTGTYFLTEGWLTGERNIWKEYQLCMEKYGQKRGKKIFSVMLAHYQNLALLDTGCFDREKLEPQVREIARTLELQYIGIDGTLEYILTLLAGPWEKERFVLVPPNSTVTADMCIVEESKPFFS